MDPGSGFSTGPDRDLRVYGRDEEFSQSPDPVKDLMDTFELERVRVVMC